MNRSLVLDASVAVEVLLAREGASASEAAMARADRLLAPDHLLLEICSAITRLIRHGAVKGGAPTSVLPHARALIDRFTPATELIEEGFALSLRHGFVPYDAIYLVLAQREGCKVLTRDGRLVRRCAAAGLSALVEPV